jgi:uncharacterized protein (DUF885 family)
MTAGNAHDAPGADFGPHQNPDVWGPRLVRVLERQVGLYQQLDELGDEQSRMVRDGDADRLIGLLARRQELVDQVTELNRDLEPFTAQWDVLSERLPSQHRQTVQGYIAQLDTLVETITKRDQADHTALEERRGALASTMGSVGRSKQAIAAYATARSQSPRYQDTEG